MMSANVATNFPPQTYSSQFFLNVLTDEVASTSKKQTKNSDTSDSSSAVLDCFISTFLSNEKKGRKKAANNGAKKMKNISAKFCLEIMDKYATIITFHDFQDISASEKALDIKDIWNSRHMPLPVSHTHPEPNSGFRIWRKSSRSPVSGLSDHGMINVGHEDMSLLKFLAINALDLTAPASDILLKSRTQHWFQLSGHPDSLAPAGPGTVWKKRSGCPDDTERLVYESLSSDPAVRDIIPKYFREVDYQGEKFIELQDLLHGFQDPYVMDIKMGTRTFLESEVSKSTARHDLYQKMVAIDPSAPSIEEHRLKAVTKLRYMQFREQQSSTCSQGFRIEAMKVRGQPPVTDLKKVKSRIEVVNTMILFLNGREDVRQRLIKRLHEIRQKFEQADYFKTHEVVGSSIFMIYDDSKVGIWIIDFAKTNKLPDGMSVTHRKPWVQGNHEEGFLFGLDQLILVLEEIRFSAPPDKFPNSTQFIPVP